jgi:hypothetical protein
MSFARDWDIALHDMLDKIDFTRDNPDWDKIALMNSNINVTTIGKISNYFIAKGDESNGDDSEVSSL